MTFAPAVGVGGVAGYKLLQKSLARQTAAFERSPVLQRNIAYFEENVAKAKTPEDLVRDRKLLTVALGAFGLGDEIDRRAYVRKALESDTADNRSFVRRIADARYLEFAKAFGYGDLTKGSNVELDSFKKDIVARYKQLEFERAVGGVDGDIRLAMNFRREAAKIAAGENVDKIGVLQALGQRPVREFLTAALGVPQAASRLDVDKQQEFIKRGLEKTFGSESMAVFKETANVDKAIQRFFALRQSQAGSASVTGAFSLLSTQNVGGAGGANLLLSKL